MIIFQSALDFFFKLPFKKYGTLLWYALSHSLWLKLGTGFAHVFNNIVFWVQQATIHRGIRFLISKIKFTLSCEAYEQYF